MAASGLMMMVFSTCVEVILQDFQLSHVIIGILHVCGGDPHILDVFRVKRVYSPRVWCYQTPIHVIYFSQEGVFSTCVEVILSASK